MAPNKQKQQKQIRWSILSCLSAQRRSRYPVHNTAHHIWAGRRLWDQFVLCGHGRAWLWAGLQVHSCTTNTTQLIVFVHAGSWHAHGADSVQLGSLTLSPWKTSRELEPKQGLKQPPPPPHQKNPKVLLRLRPWTSLSQAKCPSPPSPQAFRVCHTKEFQLCSSSSEEKSSEFIPSGRGRSSPHNVQDDKIECWVTLIKLTACTVGKMELPLWGANFTIKNYLYIIRHLPTSFFGALGVSKQLVSKIFWEFPREQSQR